MGKKSKAPPPPDYTPVAQASAEAARYSYQLGKEQLQWARDQYAMDREVSDRVVNRFLQTQDENDAAARKDRARYEQTYQPLENTLVADAQSYASPERKEMEMGRAQANVAQQFQQARQAAAQNLESYGINPNSGRFAALDMGSRVQQAAASAAAGNQASQQVDAIGRALRSEAINVGRGYPGQVAQTYGTALQSGQGAVNSQLATTASGANTMGTGMGWQGLGNQSVGTWGNTLNMGYQNQLARFQANQNASSGLGTALGIGAGLINGMSTASGATGLAAIGAMLEEGGAVPDLSGGQVPDHASPTRGAAIDDVPARLNVGEFVMPKDAVSWFGERTFQNMIQKSRKEREQAVAKPEVAIVPPEQPSYASRSALPVG